MARRSETKQFKSEAEEAAWYATPAGRRQTQREFERALKEGTLVEVEGEFTTDTLQQLMRRAKERATRAISIRLPIADIERAHAIGREKGIGYQTVLKQVIKEGLRKAG